MSAPSDRSGEPNAADETARLQRELEAADARMRFLAVAQHKLKTPLAILSGWSTMLQDWERLGRDERETGLAAINRAAVELQAQIADLLDEARSHVLQESIRLERLQLMPLLESHVETMRFDEDRHPITLDVDEDVWVRADEDALRQVLSHLLDNALKYSPDGGAIDISARLDGDRARIVVRDHGIGLPQGVDVFQPFQRGRTAMGVTRGTGLGLYIVRSLLTSMDGDVIASLPETGTSIEVSLPTA